ncbi:MAG TPA: hypothetical protein VNL18_12510 [Gemmatimonadales bacterium]|nr:hypothetical protein [Gemmatimonadales bacterium]
MKVGGVRRDDWTTPEGERKTRYWVYLEGEGEVPCYDPRAAEFQPGAELPEGWEIRTSQNGKRYLGPPKKGRDGKSWTPAWSNTQEGQAYEQERMDRRTALMQAVAYSSGGSLEELLSIADVFYSWLRQNQNSAAAPLVASPSMPAADAAAPGADSAALTSTASGDRCPSCGDEWGSRRTPSGKRLCVNGHVERQDERVVT